MPRTVIVTGMHRSGTSLITSLFRKAGVDVGERLLSASNDNPRGFFEDIDFVEFHEQALHERGQNLQVRRDFAFVPTASEHEKATTLIKQRESHAVWGWKDPRTSLFLDFWQQIVPGACFVLVYRPPLDVLLSLIRRKDLHSFGLLEGLEYWYVYNSRIKEFCERHRGATLLCHTYSVIDRIEEFSELVRNKFGLELDLNAATLNSLYHQSELRRVSLTSDIEVILRSIHAESLELYEQLNAMADLPAPNPVSSSLVRTEIEKSSELSALSQFNLSLLKSSDVARRRSLLLLLLSFLDPELVERFYEDYGKHLRELELGKAWSDGQRDSWQKVAQERESVIEEQKAWITELEQAKTWLEEQQGNWQQVVEQHEQLIQEQRSWIAELEQGKTWLEDQYQSWMKIAEEHKSQSDTWKQFAENRAATIAMMQSSLFWKLRTFLFKIKAQLGFHDGTRQSTL